MTLRIVKAEKSEAAGRTRVRSTEGEEANWSNTMFELGMPFIHLCFRRFRNLDERIKRGLY